MNDLTTLPQIVEQAFDRAIQSPSPTRWKACSVVAGCTAVRMAADGKLFLAAQMEGVADEARRQMLSMMPKEAA